MYRRGNRQKSVNNILAFIENKIKKKKLCTLHRKKQNKNNPLKTIGNKMYFLCNLIV